MNKRQAKKWKRKVALFCQLEDVYCKCYKCQNYESADMSVGLTGGCIADFLYDENGDIIESQDQKACEFMELKGYTCPYFLQLCSKKYAKDNLPKSYKEYKKRLAEINKYYGLIEKN